MKLIIAEKPSVAKSIASALGATTRADGYFEGCGSPVATSECQRHSEAPTEPAGETGKMNNIRSRVTEIVNNELIYS